MSAPQKESNKGIEGESNFHLIRGLIHISALENTFARYNNFVKQHVHKNLFQIFLVTEGKLDLIVNDQEYHIESLSFFSVPKNVQHGLDLEDNTRGWVISISDAALERILALDADIFFDIDEINIAKIDLNNPLFENLYTTLLKLIREYNGDLPAKELALEYLVGMMVIRLFRIPKESKTVLKSLDNAYKIYFRRFKQLIKENYNFEIPIEEYSATLNISKGHLNRICKEVTGKSTKKVITDYFISEAKSLLTNHKLSVMDISYKIGINDPSYFTRLFRQTEKISPRAYRKQIGLY